MQRVDRVLDLSISMDSLLARPPRASVQPRLHKVPVLRRNGRHLNNRHLNNRHLNNAHNKTISL